jgi:kynureninase
MRLVRSSPADLADVLDDDVAVVSFSAVDYRTGELFDAADVTAQAHDAGALIVWDLCHAAGAVRFELDAIGADAAVGCTYKYLNGGPGAPAWLYLPSRLQDVALPLTGWQGAADPFDLLGHYRPAPGIEHARIGTPPVFSMLALEAALRVWDDVDVADVRAKSLALTDLVLAYCEEHLARFDVHAVTPREHDRRGSQVALRMPAAYEVCQALIARGVIGDFRAPDLLRLGLAASFLTYAEVWAAMEQLHDVLATGAYRDPAYRRAPDATVT